MPLETRVWAKPKDRKELPGAQETRVIPMAVRMPTGMVPVADWVMVSLSVVLVHAEVTCPNPTCQVVK